jgi:hypothetical protein
MTNGSDVIQNHDEIIKILQAAARRLDTINFSNIYELHSSICYDVRVVIGQNFCQLLSEK